MHPQITFARAFARARCTHPNLPAWHLARLSVRGNCSLPQYTAVVNLFLTSFPVVYPPELVGAARQQVAMPAAEPPSATELTSSKQTWEGCGIKECENKQKQHRFTITGKREDGKAIDLQHLPTWATTYSGTGKAGQRAARSRLIRALARNISELPAKESRSAEDKEHFEVWTEVWRCIAETTFR